MRTRLDHATVITPRGDGAIVLNDHSVTFEDGVILSLAPSGARSAADATADDPPGLRSIDASRLIVVPGLINTHHHLFQSLTRCRKDVQNAGLFDWLTRQYPVWRRLDYDALKLAATISLAELLLSGCTTTSDHHYLFPRGGNVRIEAVLDAAESLGFRIHVCRGSMTLGASRGGLPPDDCTEDDADVLADCRRVLERFHDPSPLAMRRIDLAPCTPFNVTPELFRDTVQLARQHAALIHTHAAETLDEQAFCMQRYGVRPIGFLQERGCLGRDVYLAHCVHLDDDEIDLLAATNTGITHCPISNMRLGSGVAPLRRMLDAGCRVGLAVDGSASNDGGHLPATARQAMLLQRVVHGPSAITPAEAFRLATQGGADVLGRERLGRIELGAAADLACFRRDDVALAGAVEQDPLGALMLCHVGRADEVFIHGRRVVHEGRIERLDQDALVERFNQVVRRSWCA